MARLKESGNLLWSAAAFLISLIALAPILAIAVIALRPSGDTWSHLIANVLPGSLRRTLGLMAGVGLLSLLIGTGTAWLVTMYRFPGRRIFQWLLLLPLAIPTYIIAYSYLELLDYSGVVQSALRQLFGWRDARSYWFPDIRSLGGAIFVMSAVLYPYVYITARASFIAQSVCVLEVSRTLGRSASQTFWQVALPLARPALAAGVALALMETLNDIGAVEFFGVRTLTVAVYDTWLDRNSLAGAAQLACVMLLFVAALLLSERALTAKRRFHHTTGKYRDLPEDTLPGWRGRLAAMACALPAASCFRLPSSCMMPWPTWRRVSRRSSGRLRSTVSCSRERPPSLRSVSPWCWPTRDGRRARSSSRRQAPFPPSAMRFRAPCSPSVSSFRWQASTMASMP
jgi:iron(III) transport system permease protein